MPTEWEDEHVVRVSNWAQPVSKATAAVVAAGSVREYTGNDDDGDNNVTNGGDDDNVVNDDDDEAWRGGARGCQEVPISTGNTHGCNTHGCHSA